MTVIGLALCLAAVVAWWWAADSTAAGASPDRVPVACIATCAYVLGVAIVAGWAA